MARVLLLLGVDVRRVRLLGVPVEGASLDACQVLLQLLEELPVEAGMGGIIRCWGRGRQEDQPPSRAWRAYWAPLAASLVFTEGKRRLHRAAGKCACAAHTWLHVFMAGAHLS